MAIFVHLWNSLVIINWLQTHSLEFLAACGATRFLDLSKIFKIYILSFEVKKTRVNKSFGPVLLSSIYAK